MVLSYLIPKRSYSFFQEIIPLLEEKGIEVQVNDISSRTDIILAGILPLTTEWIRYLEHCDKPFVIWHWDLYSTTDYTEGRWERFLDLLPKAVDVWSCSYETARELKEHLKLDSYMMPAWIDTCKFPKPQWNSYVLYAASGCGFGKRIDWAERACTLIKLPLTVLRNQNLSKEDYLKHLTGCCVYLMTAFEESNGSIPAMEAAAIGKPLVIADIPTNREVFGNADGVFYFQSCNFRDLLKQLRLAWTCNHPCSDLAYRIQKMYDVSKVSVRMSRRLKELEYCLNIEKG